MNNEQNEQQDYTFETFEDFAKDWSNKYGSEKLKKGIASGFDMDELFNQEYTKKTLEPFGFVSQRPENIDRISHAIAWDLNQHQNSSVTDQDIKIVSGYGRCEPTLLQLKALENLSFKLENFRQQSGYNLIIQEDYCPFVTHKPFYLSGLPSTASITTGGSSISNRYHVAGYFLNVRLKNYQKPNIIYTLLPDFSTVKIASDIKDKIIISLIERNTNIDNLDYINYQVDRILRSHFFPEQEISIDRFKKLID